MKKEYIFYMRKLKKCILNNFYHPTAKKIYSFHLSSKKYIFNPLSSFRSIYQDRLDSGHLEISLESDRTYSWGFFNRSPSSTSLLACDYYRSGASEWVKDDFVGESMIPDWSDV